MHVALTEATDSTLIALQCRLEPHLYPSTIQRGRSYAVHSFSMSLDNEYTFLVERNIFPRLQSISESSPDNQCTKMVYEPSISLISCIHRYPSNIKAYGGSIGASRLTCLDQRLAYCVRRLESIPPCSAVAEASRVLPGRLRDSLSLTLAPRH